MLFNSYVFLLLFLPLALALSHWFIRRGSANVPSLILIAVSLGFDAWWASRYLRLVSIAINFYEALIRAAGKGTDLDEWRERVRSIAVARNVKLFELNRETVFSSARLDRISGFNDPSHFSEWIGTMMRGEMGLPIKAGSPPSGGMRI